MAGYANPESFNDVTDGADWGDYHCSGNYALMRRDQCGGNSDVNWAPSMPICARTASELAA